TGEASADVAARVARARAPQADRFAADQGVRVNADAQGDLLLERSAIGDEAKALLTQVAERFGLSARAYHRVLRVARTIADLAGSDEIARAHVAEAALYRLTAEDRKPAAVATERSA
ncbi:MAG: hypothetical protein HUJ24_11840, partial [Rhodobacteraceae bacterium]|nr:hypothetical protein [Paracoccaceae bacterium]